MPTRGGCDYKNRPTAADFRSAPAYPPDSLLARWVMAEKDALRLLKKFLPYYRHLFAVKWHFLIGVFAGLFIRGSLFHLARKPKLNLGWHGWARMKSE